MEELNLYKCADGPADMGGHHHGAHISGHGGRQCLVRGDGETSLIRNGGRPVETEQRCPLIPHKVSQYLLLLCVSFSNFFDSMGQQTMHIGPKRPTKDNIWFMAFV